MADRRGVHHKDRYVVYSYDRERGDQKCHARFHGRGEAEGLCRRLVAQLEQGRQSAHVMRLFDGMIVYHYDRTELLFDQAPGGAA